MNSNLNLINYTLQPVSEELSLTLPSLKIFDNDFFSSLIHRIHMFCKENPQNIQGNPFCTFSVDLSQKNVTVKTSQGEKNLNHIRMTSYVIDNKCATIKWELDLQNETHETYITGRTDLGISPSFFNGFEYERIFSPSAYSLIPTEFWDVWESVMSEEVMHYKTIIYPQIIYTIQKICKLNPLVNLDILDLGGGSGNLAETILEERTLSNLIRKIIVIDSSKKLIEKAQIKAINYPDKLIPKHISIEEVSKQLYNSSEYVQSAHIIILCGVVAHQVLSRKVGLDIVAKCQSILRENGILIVASLSPALINSVEYQEMGYNVLNKSFSFLLPSCLSVKTNDFYILQKKASSD